MGLPMEALKELHRTTRKVDSFNDVKQYLDFSQDGGRLESMGASRPGLLDRTRLESTVMYAT